METGAMPDSQSTNGDAQAVDFEHGTLELGYAQAVDLEPLHTLAITHYGPPPGHIRSISHIPISPVEAAAIDKRIALDDQILAGIRQSEKW